MVGSILQIQFFLLHHLAISYTVSTLNGVNSFTTWWAPYFKFSSSSSTTYQLVTQCRRGEQLYHVMGSILQIQLFLIHHLAISIFSYTGASTE
jgi:hypothetical protein